MQRRFGNSYSTRRRPYMTSFPTGFSVRKPSCWFGSCSYPVSRSSTRKRRRRRQRSKTSYYKKKDKTLTKRREALGLPPLELKRVVQTNGFSSGQYATFVAATTWSASHDFTDIAIGESTSTRTSQNVTVLPFTYTLNCYQALSNTCNYRFLLIKVFDQIDVSDVVPNVILADTTSVSQALISQYKDADDRTFRFKILKDRFYTWSTYDGHTTSYRRFFMKFKTKNRVRYDPDDATGDTASGHLLFVMLTDATPASASFTRGGSYTMNFLDM